MSGDGIDNLYKICAIAGTLWAVGTFLRNRAQKALSAMINKGLEKVNNDNAWIMMQLKPKNGETLCEIVEGQVAMISDHGRTLLEHTEQLTAQDESLRRIEERTGEVAGKVMAVHASEGQKLEQIQKSIVDAKDEAASTAKEVKETLSNHRR